VARRRSARETSERGTLAWKPLPRGRWQVATEDRGVVATVLVDGPGTEMSLRGE
jgi:hypothetical protein